MLGFLSKNLTKSVPFKDDDDTEVNFMELRKQVDQAVAVLCTMDGWLTLRGRGMTYCKIQFWFLVFLAQTRWQPRRVGRRCREAYRTLPAPTVTQQVFCSTGNFKDVIYLMTSAVNLSWDLTLALVAGL